MKTINNLHEVVTANGNVLRGHIEVSGREYTVESDGETWVNIIDDEAHCETRTIDGALTVFESGECVSESWTEGDEKQFDEFVSWTPSSN